MSGIRSRSTAPKNTVPFRHPAFFEDYEDFTGDLEQYKDTDRDCAWYFRRYKTNGDAEDISLRVVEARIDWDAMAASYAKSGGNVVVSLLDSQPLTHQRAELLQMTARLNGSFFCIPEDFTVGDADRTENEEPHPLAGESMPVEPEWLNTLDEDVLDAATAFLKTLYTRRSPAEEATFPPEPVPVADAEGTANRKRTGRAA